MNTPKPCLAGNTLRTKSLRLLLPPPPPLPQTMPAHLFLLLLSSIFHPLFSHCWCSPRTSKTFETKSFCHENFTVIIFAVRIHCFSGFLVPYSSQHRQRPYGYSTAENSRTRHTKQSRFSRIDDDNSVTRVHTLSRNHNIQSNVMNNSRGVCGN